MTPREAGFWKLRDVLVLLLIGAVAALILTIMLATPPPPRPTCPAGYALISNFGSKPYCSPNALEPVYR
jgi:hypothetical protein